MVESTKKELRSEDFSELPKHVLKRIEVQDNGCWYFLGNSSDGYGLVRFQGKVRPAHRVVRFLIRKDIPLEGTSDTILDHGPFCGYRGCVHPYHNVPGTRRENSLTANSPNMTTYRTGVCRNNHDLSIDENVHVTTNGSRECKVCARERDRKYREENKDKVNARQKQYDGHHREEKLEYNRITNRIRTVASRYNRGLISKEEAGKQIVELKAKQLGLYKL